MVYERGLLIGVIYDEVIPGHSPKLYGCPVIFFFLVHRQFRKIKGEVKMLLYIFAFDNIEATQPSHNVNRMSMSFNFFKRSKSG